MDKDKIKKAVSLFLEGIGEDPEREGLLETPDRIAKMCEELFGGYEADAAVIWKRHLPLRRKVLCWRKTLPFIRYVSTTFLHFQWKSSHWIHPGWKSSGA